MKLRLALEDDIPELIRIYRHYVDYTSITFDLEIPAYGDFLNKLINSHLFLVSEGKEGLDGYAYAGSHRSKPAYQWACESTIYLDEGSTGLGIGKGLYTAVIEILALLNIKSILAGITRPNPSSIAFHRSLGFEHAYSYENIGFKLGVWHSVDWYRLDIGEQKNIQPPELLSISEVDHRLIEQVLSSNSTGIR